MSGFLRGGLLRPNSIHTSANAKWYRAGGASAPVFAYTFKGAASQAASLVNLANPGTYDLAAGSASTWAAATGLTFDGVGQYYTTGATPAANWTLAIRFSNATNADRYFCGASDGTKNFGFSRISSSGGKISYWNGGNNQVAPTIAAGVLIVAAGDCYRNGVADGTIASPNTPTTRTIYLGCLNFNATASFFMACNILAFAGWSSKLDSTMAPAVATAMAAL